MSNLSKEVEAEEFRLQKAQQATISFVEKVRALHTESMAYLDQLQELCPPDTTPLPDKVDEAVSEIDDNVQRLLAQAMKDATAENLRAKVEREEEDLEDTAEFGPVDPESPAPAEESGEEEEDEDPPSPGEAALTSASSSSAGTTRSNNQDRRRPAAGRPSPFFTSPSTHPSPLRGQGHCRVAAPFNHFSR